MEGPSQIDRLRKRVAELDRKVFEYHSLLKAGEALHNELQVDRLCELLCAILRERLPRARIAVLLASPDSEVATAARVDGLPDKAADASFPLTDGILRRLLLDREPFSVVDVSGAPRFGEIWESYGLDALRAELWVPMVTKGDVIGVVSLGGLDVDELDDSDRLHEFLRSLVSQAAVAFGTAFLYRKTQIARHDLDQSLHKLSLLFDVTRALSAVSDLTHLLRLILDRAIAGVDAAKGSLMLLDELTDELVIRVVRGLPDRRLERRINEGLHDCSRFKRGEGVAGRVLESGHAVRLSDVHAPGGFAQRMASHVESIICVPLRSDDDVIGVLNVTNKAGGAKFSEQDEEILEALANQAAVAISRTRLYEAAISDSLTHLYVRRFMMHRLKEEVRRAARYNQPLALIMCDIDHFKTVNDTFGHPAGDVVLAEVAAVLRAGLRENVDLPGRYGGEEFVLVLPNTDTEGARLVAERLRQAVEQSTYDGAARDVPAVTMSFGVAGLDPALRESPDELLSRADQALYQAKHGGRNRVALAPLPIPGGPRRTSSVPGGGRRTSSLPGGHLAFLGEEETTPTRPPAMHPSSGEFLTIPREDPLAGEVTEDELEPPADMTVPSMPVVK